MTLHTTWIRPDGTAKADIAPPRMYLFGHQKLGGVIRLTDDAEVETGLGIAEGVEDALSIMHLLQWRPVWSALDAGGIKSFPLLGGLDALTIFADPDKRGMQAANTCAERWLEAGRTARVVRPLEVSSRPVDWNKRLLQGRHG